MSVVTEVRLNVLDSQVDHSSNILESGSLLGVSESVARHALLINIGDLPSSNDGIVFDGDFSTVIGKNVTLVIPEVVKGVLGEFSLTLLGNSLSELHGGLGESESIGLVSCGRSYAVNCSG